MRPVIVPMPEARPYRSPAPEQGFVSSYVRYGLSRTDAPAEAHELLSVGILSALAGPAPHIPIATAVNGWRLTLWIMYIVNSAAGRKSTTLNLALDILKAALGDDRVIEWEGSPQ